MNADDGRGEGPGSALPDSRTETEKLRSCVIDLISVVIDLRAALLAINSGDIKRSEQAKFRLDAAGVAIDNAINHMKETFGE